MLDRPHAIEADFLGEQHLLDHLVVDPALGLAGRLGDLGADGVVLVSRDRDRGENADDRHHDHQFDECETFLDRLHLKSPD